MSVMKQEKITKAEKKEYTQRERDIVVEKLITARVGLLLKHAFFGNLATRLKLIDASNWCSTLATDGRNFYYNVGFVQSLDAKEVEFGFAHEILHNVFDHFTRRGDRDPQLHNIAADFAVNQILIDDKIGMKPKSIRIFQHDKYRGWSSEEIYEDLEKNAIKININDLGELLDDHIDWGDDGGGQGNGQDGDKEGQGRPKLSKEEMKKIRDELKEAMISAAQAAGAGNVPAGVRRLITDFTEPKMDWRQLLRLNIQSIIKSNYSFVRPNRKSFHSGAILPGMMNEETIDIACAIDMSGSISDKMAKDFVGEIKGIMDEYVDYKITLWCFDTDVYNVEIFTADNGTDLMNYEVKGGGGTDFDANWEYMKENNIEPKKFVMFTDGYPCGSWGDENYCDTLFIIHGNDEIKSPWGQFAHYK
jgi:predicted metal-dependent peptidase